VRRNVETVRLRLELAAQLGGGLPAHQLTQHTLVEREVRVDQRAPLHRHQLPAPLRRERGGLVEAGLEHRKEAVLLRRFGEDEAGEHLARLARPQGERGGRGEPSLARRALVALRLVV